MSSEIAIEVDSLSKCYQIYDQPRDRLKQFIVPRLQRMAGRNGKQYYRDFWALKDVSFTVRKGETIGIIGRNGSGKSTLLQMICGTLNPSAGEIRTHGRVAALLELGSGFNPEFTGRENVFLNASVLGLTHAETEARFAAIEAFADIGRFIEQPVKSYSSGMMVRLAFAVIAHVDADILIVDEALSVGDAFFTQKCMRFLREFMENGTVLFVSHDTAAVVNLCDRAVLLDHGTVAMVGTAKEVIEKYLATLYADNQAVDMPAIALAPASVTSAEQYRDMREDLFRSSTLRNDIEIFRFAPEAVEGFGAGGTTVTAVRLLDKSGSPLSWMIGGEMVSLEVKGTANVELTSPIVGFQFKDRLGQIIFSDNTFVASLSQSPRIPSGAQFAARFDFCLPVLPSGDYSITVAVADGSQEDHVQHQWLHDALIVRSHASHVASGLIGVAMRAISLTVGNAS